MKSITSRITVWHAATMTATLFCMFVVGHVLLENYLIRQLDKLDETQFNHLKSTLGPDYQTLTPQLIGDRIREATDSASSLFYADMHSQMTHRFFRSGNLHGLSIPDVPGEDAYTVDLDGVGELRVREFKLPPFEVLVATPVGPVRDVMAGYRKVFFLLLVAAMIASGAIGYALSQLFLRPVRLIQATANRIRADNLNERIPVGDVRDEFSSLARFLNQMFDRLEKSFSEIRHFTADASHELKTPLSLVRLHAERLLVKGDLEPAQREGVQVQLEELARVDQIIDELLFLSRADAHAITLNPRETDAADFLAGFAQDASALAEYNGRKFAYTHHGEGTVVFEAKRIRQVLLNLLANAIKASPQDGRISLRSVVAGGMWRISVEDEGPGLTVEQRDKLFERFVRFDSNGEGDRGSGLGLAICRSIVRLHRGRIVAAEGASGRGLRIEIELPAPLSLGTSIPRESVTAHE
jgi:two-component system heavy metal sensor histidine kinase CusS